MTARILFLGCLFLLYGTGVNGDEIEKPMWSVDLRPFSYASRPNPKNIGGQPYIDGKFADAGIIFRTSDEVICYFVTKPTVAALQRRTELESGSFQLQLVSFAADTGRLRYRKELPARAGVTWMMVNPEGRLIVRTGDFLRLYSADLATYNERLLPSAWLRGWEVRSSPTGKTLALVYSSSPLEKLELLDGRSLAVIGSSQSDHLPRSFAISDIGIVQLGRVQTGTEKSLWIRQFLGEWQKLPGATALACISGNPAFINNDILLNACDHEVALLSLSGSILMRDTVESKERLEEIVAVTPDGRFFAISAMQTKGGFMDYSSRRRSRTRVLVYDAVLRKRIASIQIEPIPTKDYDFALAPDGGTLAVMTDSKVSLYRI